MDVMVSSSHVELHNLVNIRYSSSHAREVFII